MSRAEISGWLWTVLTVEALVLAGCASQTRYIDPTGPEAIVSEKIDTQDWARAADELVGSLLASGVLDRAPNKPAVLAVSRIINKTTQQIDTDMLTKKIRVALNQSGKALTTTVIGLGGQAEDPLAQGEAQRREFFEEGTGAGPRRPDFTLSGKIIEETARAEGLKQKTYLFQMSLTDVNTGLAVWEDERAIGKIIDRPKVGW